MFFLALASVSQVLRPLPATVLLWPWGVVPGKHWAAAALPEDAFILVTGSETPVSWAC